MPRWWLCMAALAASASVAAASASAAASSTADLCTPAAPADPCLPGTPRPAPIGLRSGLGDVGSDNSALCCLCWARSLCGALCSLLSLYGALCARLSAICSLCARLSVRALCAPLSSNCSLHAAQCDLLSLRSFLCGALAVGPSLRRLSLTTLCVGSRVRVLPPPSLPLSSLPPLHRSPFSLSLTPVAAFYSFFAGGRYDALIGVCTGYRQAPCFACFTGDVRSCRVSPPTHTPHPHARILSLEALTPHALIRMPSPTCPHPTPSPASPNALTLCPHLHALSP